MKGIFKLGDVVRLISGGPMMTVSTIDPIQSFSIGCLWFDEDDGLPHLYKFPEEALEQVELFLEEV